MLEDEVHGEDVHVLQDPPDPHTATDSQVPAQYTTLSNFHQLGSLGQVGLVVTKSACVLFVCVLFVCSSQSASRGSLSY